MSGPIDDDIGRSWSDYLSFLDPSGYSEAKLTYDVASQNAVPAFQAKFGPQSGPQPVQDLSSPPSWRLAQAQANLQRISGLGSDPRVLILQVKDPVGVAAAQGGAAAGLLAKAAPDTVATMVLEKFGEQIVDGAKEKGVEVTAKVVSASSLGALGDPPTNGKSIWLGIGIGAAGVGVGWGIFKLIKRLLGG